MLRKKIGVAIAGAICTASLAAAVVSAQTYDKRTIYTFSGPVEIPGASLPAGQYVFHLADPSTSRQVLQVMSADGQKVYGMFFSMPVERPTASDDPQVTFMEAAKGEPPAIRVVWYGGERTGRELIYPRDQAKRLARTAKEPVLTTKAETTKAEQANSGDLERISGEQNHTAENNAPAPPVTAPSTNDAVNHPAPAVMAQNDTRPAPVGTSGRSAADTQRSELPKTASTTPLWLLCAVGFLSVAGAVRVWRLARA